jgi:regulator of protease activity HflC (stomatin/prohibitin superfamily)
MSDQRNFGTTAHTERRGLSLNGWLMLPVVLILFCSGFWLRVKISLRARNLVSEMLKVNDRLGNPIEIAGIVVWRIADTAQAMLRRQQADAVIGARQKIVSGAVSMVEMALAQLQERGIIEFDPERKASMVSNLLVVLCGESDAQPVINTGTLYH